MLLFDRFAANLSRNALCAVSRPHQPASPTRVQGASDRATSSLGMSFLQPPPGAPSG